MRAGGVWTRGGGAVLAAAVLALATASAAGAATLNSYSIKKATADQSGKAPHVDANLVDPWGLAASTGSPWWVANAGTGTSAVYAADGTPSALVVAAPTSPTGIVFNGGSGFVAGNGTRALFLYCTLDGSIRAWNSAMGTTSEIVALGTPAVYTGLAIDSTSHGDYLLAANFLTGAVEVFDTNFEQTHLTGAFVDPNLPAGYAPFGIASIGGSIFVTYALQSVSGLDAPGAGHGVVAAYDSDGALLATVATAGPLNSPWGLAKAPKSFGRFGGDLLVGNSGNGRINAYRWTGSQYVHHGLLRLSDGTPLAVSGLHGLAFGNGGNAGPKSRLYFAAGPGKGAHGRLGWIRTG